MATGSAYPVIEVSRHFVDPGLSAHEFASIAFTAALIVTDPNANPTDTAAKAAAFADAVLAHRGAK